MSIRPRRYRLVPFVLLIFILFYLQALRLRLARQVHLPYCPLEWGMVPILPTHCPMGLMVWLTVQVMWEVMVMRWIRSGWNLPQPRSCLLYTSPSPRD